MRRAYPRAMVAAVAVLSAAIMAVGLQPLPEGSLGGVPDSLAHGAAYAVLGCVSAAAAGALGVAWAPVWGWTYSVAHGAALELLQLLVPSRTAEWRDLIADGVGAMLGAILAWASGRRR